MSKAHADRNLLFGILALQMDFITRDALIAAMNAWVLAKEKPLGEILLGQGALREDAHVLLEALVRKHLEMHGDDAEQSLAALSSVGSVREGLRQVADPDVAASLAHVSLARQDEDDPNATRPESAGTPTSAGLRFRILRPHARGGLGEVFVAHDEELHREVALKEIKGDRADNEQDRARFLLEAHVTGGLEHPGIVPVYGLGTYADGRPFYAMRFIRGDSLHDAIKRFHGPASPRPSVGERTVQLRKLLGRFLDVCNAIEYAHSRGVLHRDLKPGNIMLGQYGETLVVDWGLAKPQGSAVTTASAPEGALRPAAAGDVTPTQAGTALGTPAYMAPEQAAGRLDLLGPTSDVYSLGATLYCLLTGRAPFQEKDKVVVLGQVQRGEFPQPRQVDAGVSPTLEAVCLKAMALKPEDRHSSPSALADDIEHFLADEPVTAYRDPISVRFLRWGRRHRTMVTAGAALVVATALALAIILVAVNVEKEKTEAALGQVTEEKGKTKEALDEKTAALDQSEKAEKRARIQRQIAIETVRSIIIGILKELEDRPAQADLRNALLQHALNSLVRLIPRDSPIRRSAVKKSEAKVELGDFWLAEGGTAKGTDLFNPSGEPGARTQPREDGETAKRKDLYNPANELASKLVESSPKSAEARRDLSSCLNTLADISLLLGDPGSARAIYEKRLKLCQQLADADKASIEAQRDLHIVHNKLGDLYLDMSKPLKVLQARQHYQMAMEIAKRLADADPASAQAQHDLANSYRRLGDLYGQGGKRKEALEQYRQGIEVAQHIIDDLREDPTDFYDTASFFALSISLAEKAESKEKYAARAVELLREAVARGYKDAARLKSDTDFVALRPRDDFKKLVAELEAASKPTNMKEK